ncbi:glycosyltransferase family 1 protein [bacterium D16-51]|nr:glycosyltransferase family 1 protein [bacterium D16-59]RKI56966.1 glycosyltransferase family 1 protein [bacterium D16-51]
MKRLLCIVGGMNAGGAETYLMKLLRQLDRENYHIDFCVMICGEGYYDKEIKELGGKIFHVPPKTRNPVKSFWAIRKIVQDGQYKSVLRISQNSLSCMELYAAKLGGAKKLCFRSSNSDTCGNFWAYLIHVVFKPWLNVIANVKIAPSTEAGVFMFGKRQVKRNRVFFLRNAIDLKEFTYNKAVREKYRAELGIRGKYVIGHVGRFARQKNHSFLLDVFSEVHKRNRNAALILVGDGELQKEIKEKVSCLRLENSVIFLGVRKDIAELMNAMDLFLLPSLYEGMPNALIEAQAVGLPCISSSNITREANITGMVRYISLEKPEKWIRDIVCRMEQGSISRKSMEDQYKEHGYDIESACRIFEKLVFMK